MVNTINARYTGMEDNVRRQELFASDLFMVTGTLQAQYVTSDLRNNHRPTVPMTATRISRITLIAEENPNLKNRMPSRKICRASTEVATQIGRASCRERV